MFAKLLKQEFRATAGGLGLACLGALSAGIAGGLSIRFLVQRSMDGGFSESAPNLGEILGVFALLTAVLVLVFCGAGCLFMLIARFYKSRFTDEGYLTFTLPVSTHQNLLSSLVHTFLCMAVTVVVLVVSVGIMALLCVPFAEVWEELFTAIRALFDAFEMDRVKNILLTLFNALSGSLYILICVMLSITLGALMAKKHKLLAAVGFFYGINLADSLLMNTLLMKILLSEDPTVPAIPGLVHLVLSIAGYWLMYHFVDKRLNLS